MRKWTPRWDELVDTEVDGPDFVETGVALSVLVATRLKYEGSFSRYIDFIAKFGHPISLHSFGRFLRACRRQGAKGSTLEGYRSSLLFVQRANNMAPFADAPLLIRAIKGYRYADRLTCAPRGAITLHMLAELVEFDPVYALEYATIFHLVIRAMQALKMRGGDGRETTDGALTLIVRVDKRMNAGNTREVTSSKEIVAPDAKAVAIIATSSVPYGTLVFPNFDPARASRVIHAAAIALKWPAGLQFDGVHCLRHGGAQAAKLFYTNLMTRMGNHAAMAPRPARWYTRLNALRTAAIEADEDFDDEPRAHDA